VVITVAHSGCRDDLLQGVREVLQHHDGRRTGVGQLMLQFTRGVERINVDHHQAGAQRAEQRHRVLQQVGQHDGHPLALAQSHHLLQVGAEIAGEAIDFAVAQGDAHVGEGGALAEPLATLFEHVLERSEAEDVDFRRNALGVVLQPDGFHVGHLVPGERDYSVMLRVTTLRL